jgi:hypothetical protein
VSFALQVESPKDYASKVFTLMKIALGWVARRVAQRHG